MLTIPGLFIESLGWVEILIIGVVAVLLFGKRLPEVGRNLGKSITSFKKGINEMKDELNNAVAEEETPPAAAPAQAPSPVQITAAPQDKIVCNACAEFDRAKTVTAEPAEEKSPEA